MGRDPNSLLIPLIELDQKFPFDEICFVSNQIQNDELVKTNSSDDLTNHMIAWSKEQESLMKLKNTWCLYKSTSNLNSFLTINDAIAYLRHMNDVHVFVTGSLHLVGGVMTAIGAPVE